MSSSINRLIRQTTIMALTDSNNNNNDDDNDNAVNVNEDDDYHNLVKSLINTIPSSTVNGQNEEHIEQTFVPNELIAKSFAKYYPEEANFWMYAMIVLGLAFIVFVAITIYKLCQPENDGRLLKQKRSGSIQTHGTNIAPTTIIA